MTTHEPDVPLPQHSPGSPAILVVEDEMDDVLLMKRGFNAAGITTPVRFVYDGSEAIDYLQGKPPFDNRVTYPMPTLLLLDLKLPKVTGFEVLDWLRNQPQLKDLMVIVFSGSEWKPDMDAAHAAGANLYLLKPTDWKDFVVALQRVNQDLVSRK
jgi:CheY-like chemotaxis protein